MPALTMRCRTPTFFCFTNGATNNMIQTHVTLTVYIETYVVSVYTAYKQCVMH